MRATKEEKPPLNSATCADPGNFLKGGGPGPSDKKKLDILVFFFSVLNLFTEGLKVYFKDNTTFQRFQRGSNFFQGVGGVQLFQGVQLLIPNRNPYNL